MRKYYTGMRSSDSKLGEDKVQSAIMQYREKGKFHVVKNA